MTEPIGNEAKKGKTRIDFSEESDEDDDGDSQAKAGEKPKKAASPDDSNAKHMAKVVKTMQEQLKRAATSLKKAEEDLQAYETAEQQRAAEWVEGPKEAPGSQQKNNR